MNSTAPRLRFQGHSATWAALTAGPLTLCSAVLLYLGWYLDSTAWMVFSATALTCCLALASFRFRVEIDPSERRMDKAWCLGPLPLLRREGDLTGLDYVSLAPAGALDPHGARGPWQLIEPRFRVTLFVDAGSVTIGAFYREEPARAVAEQAAGALGMPLYDKTGS
jgi:hypothetical protein